MNVLTESELESTSGGLGVIETIVVATTVLVITSIVNNWDAFKAGLAGDPYPRPTAVNK